MITAIDIATFLNTATFGEMIRRSEMLADEIESGRHRFASDMDSVVSILRIPEKPSPFPMMGEATA
jgi:hypothetical protein